MGTCKWNEPALATRFVDLKDEIHACEFPASLDQLVELAIHLEKRFELCRRTRGLFTDQWAVLSTVAIASGSCLQRQPIQLGGIRISKAE